MASLGMYGPYEFTKESIKNNCPDNKPGNYALGYLNDMSVFIVQYVGRSDTDLQKRLLQHIGENYKHFKAVYISTQEERYKKECINFHDFGGSDKLNNESHPARPYDSSKCPICSK